MDAIQVNPLSPWRVWALLLVLLLAAPTALGQQPDARKELLDGRAALGQGRRREALAAFTRGHDLDPTHPDCAYDAARVSALLGEIDDAFSWLERSFEAGLGNNAGELERFLDEPDLQALRLEQRYVSLRDRIERRWLVDMDSSFEVACRHAAEGHKELALDWLERALVLRWGTVEEDVDRLDTESRLDSIRNDGAFTAILDRAMARRDVVNDVQSMAVQSERLDLFDGHRDAVHSVDFSPDGRLLVTGCRDRSVRVWDVDRGDVKSVYRGHASAVLAARFFPDGNSLLTAGVDTTARIIGVRSGHPSAVIGARGIVQRAAVSPDGRWVATAGMQTRAAHVWDVENEGALVTPLDGHAGPVWSVEFDPQNPNRVVTASEDGTIRTWELPSGRSLRVVELGHATMRQASFDPTGHRILVTGFDGNLYMLDAATGNRLLTVRRNPLRQWVSSAFSPQGSRVASTSARLTPDGLEHRVHVWEAATGRELLTLSDHTDYVVDVAFHPDGDRIATASLDSTVRIWDAHTGEELQVLGHQIPGLSTAAFVPGQPELVVAGPNGALKWDLRSGELSPDNAVGVTRVRVGQSPGKVAWRDPRIHDVAGKDRLITLHRRAGLPGPDEAYVSPSGTRAYTVHRILVGPNRAEQWVGVLWDAEEGEPVISPLLHQPRRSTGDEPPWAREISRASFDSSGERLATYSHAGNEVYVLDATSGERICVLRGHEREVFQAVFSPDGEQITTAGADGITRTWDATSGAPLLDLQRQAREVSCVSYDPRGGVIATGGHDTRIRLWDTDTGAQIGALRGHTRPVLHLAYDEGGRRLVSTSLDETVRLWDVRRGRLLATLVDYGNGDGLAFTPQLAYTGSEEAASRASLVLDGKPIPLANYAETLHDPELVQLALRGRSSPSLPILPPPSVTIIDPPRPTITVHDRKLRIEARIEDRLGIEDVEVLVDGQPWKQGDLRLAISEEAYGLHLQATVPVHDPTTPSSRTIAVRATNKAGTIGREERVRIHYEPPKEELFVLAVGVADYADHEDLSLDLACPVNDVRSLVDCLKRQEGGMYSTVHVQTLEDKEVSRDSVFAGLYEFLVQAQPDDTILVFLAGHGVKLNGEYWFLTHGALPDSPFIGGIQWTQIMSLVESRQLRAKRRILMLDTCYAGAVEGARDAQRGGPVTSQEEIEPPSGQEIDGLYVLTAGRDDQLAIERDGHGLFTRAVIDGLNGAADVVDPNGQVEVEELKIYVERRVREESSRLQEPAFQKVVGGLNFPITRTP